MRRAARLMAAALLTAPPWIGAPAVAAECAPPPDTPPVALRADGPTGLIDAAGRRFVLSGLSPERSASQRTGISPATSTTASAMRLAPIGEPDRYGRQPVLAFDGDQLLNSRLLAAGEALLRSDPDVPLACWRAMEAAESAAILAGAGVWRRPGPLRQAGDAEALKAAEKRLIVVEGRVRSVRTVRRLTYVNFGPPGAGALTITIAERDRPSFRAEGLEPERWRGQTLRARGVVVMRRGPSIAATSPRMVTIDAAP